MAITPTEGDKVRKLVGLACALVLTVLGVIAPATTASAHQGNIKVSATDCVDGNSMKATYTVGWSNGTSSGKLYTKSGLYSGGTSTSGWDFEKNVSGASGSASFTKTHTFSGSNGPWIAFKILAAGALHPKDSFPFAFKSGADFICVGMYDFQVVEDVNLVNAVLDAPIERKRPWRA